MFIEKRDDEGDGDDDDGDDNDYINTRNAK